MGKFVIKATLGCFVYDFPEKANPYKVILEGKVVPIAKRKTGIPKEIAAVIDKAISPKPQNRYPTAMEMKKALAQARR